MPSAFLDSFDRGGSWRPRRRGGHVHSWILACGVPSGLEDRGRLVIRSGGGPSASHFLRLSAPQWAPAGVVSVSGDGGFLFGCGELATVAQEQVPLTAVIVDDGGYGMLRYDQRNAGDEPFGVDLVSPDYEAMARSFGVVSETVEGLGKEFGEALSDHVIRDSPSVLAPRAALQPPPTTSPRWYRAG